MKHSVTGRRKPRNVSGGYSLGLRLIECKFGCSGRLFRYLCDREKVRSELHACQVNTAGRGGSHTGSAMQSYGPVHS